MILRWLSYPRSLLMTALYPPFLVLFSIYGIVLNLIFDSRKIDNRTIKVWCRLTCAMFGVKVEVTGEENLKTHEGGVILFNHTSFFDIFALHSVVSNLRFGAKIELFAIPFFGSAMRRTGVLPIARKNLGEVIRVYHEAESRIRNGEKFALAPEGTRQDTEALGPFKSGPFIFAINCKAPVIPVIIKGAHDVLANTSWVPNVGKWNRTIKIHILAPISTSEYSIEQRSELQKKVYLIMKEYFPN